MVKRRVFGLMAGGLLALATALIAVSGSAFAAGAVGPNTLVLNTTGGTVGHQTFPIAWDADMPGDCGPYTPTAGQVVWHFILTSPSDSPNPAHLYPHFVTAGLLGPINEYTRSGAVHWYVLTPTRDTLTGIWTDNAGGNLNLSHICVGPDPSASPTVEITATPYESIGGETGTPIITATPYESVGGETAYPSSSSTTPPTSTASGPFSGNATPLMALLICVAFGSLGLMAVEVQRRRIRR